MTLENVLGESIALLENSSPTARLDAEVLITHALDKARSYLYTWPERKISAPELDRIRQLVKKRTAGTPVAYITGKKEFWSRNFNVCPDVLIPRPETELLIELCLNRIPEKSALDIADLGTGSGAIAITLALERPSTRIVAVDINSVVLEAAKANAQAHGAENIIFRQSDWFDGLKPNIFDIIVSNPPYIEDTNPHFSITDIRFEPTLALAAGPDGLDAIRRISQQARQWLRPKGIILIEHGYNQENAVQGILTGEGFHSVATHKDLQGHPRVTAAHRDHG